MATTGDILSVLLNEDKNSDGFPEFLRGFLQSEEYPTFTSALEGHEKVEFLEFLDKAIDAVAKDFELYNKGLRCLRRLCGMTLYLPTSHWVSHDLRKREEQPIAKGGNADVYVGIYQGRLVALKCLRASAVEGSLQKTFCKEVVIWKRLSHPNVLPFLGVSNTVAPLCMVSEWMENGDIVDYLYKHADANRLELLLDVAKGLEYLHSRQVVHGDLKGANILVDTHGNARLADFGLASITIDSGSNNASSFHSNHGGTARWMAPELMNPELSGNSVARPTAASDVYSFAMVVVEVFTGDVPFCGLRSENVVYMVLDGQTPPRPPGGIELGLTNDLWTLVQACWNMERERRPTVSEIRHCLQSEVLVSKQRRVQIVDRTPSARSRAAISSSPHSSIYSLPALSNHSSTTVSPTTPRTPLKTSRRMPEPLVRVISDDYVEIDPLSIAENESVCHFPTTPGPKTKQRRGHTTAKLDSRHMQPRPVAREQQTPVATCNPACQTQ